MQEEAVLIESPPVSDPHDLQALVLRAQDGSVEATAELFAEFGPLAERLTHRYEHLCNHFGILEDLPGEIFVAFAQLIHDFDGGRGVSFFQFVNRLLPAAVHASVRHHCRLLARERAVGQHPQEWQEVCGHASQSGSEESLETAELVDRLALTEALNDALNQLPARQATIVRLIVIQGRDHGEVAAALGTTPAAVRSLYLTARRRLHRALRGSVGPQEESAETSSASERGRTGPPAL